MPLAVSPTRDRDAVTVLDRVVDHVRDIEAQILSTVESDHPLAVVLDPDYACNAVYRAWFNVLATRRHKRTDLVAVRDQVIRACAWVVKLGADILVIERGEVGATYATIDMVRLQAGAPTPIDKRDDGEIELTYPREVFVRLHHVWQNFVHVHRRYRERRCNPAAVVDACAQFAGRLAWAATLLGSFSEPVTVGEDDEKD